MTLIDAKGPELGLVPGDDSIPLPEVLIISGTGAPPFGLNRFYSRQVQLYQAAGHTTHVRNIYHMGIGRLDRALEEVEKCYFSSTDTRQFVVVGHSQGALLALALANLYPGRVVRVELFGTPWYGTRLAPLWVPIPAVRAMTPQSRWIREHRGHNNHEPAKVHSYFSAFDPLVVPWWASFVKEGQNYLVVPRKLERLALTIGRRAIGPRILDAEVLHGFTDHLWLPNHQVVIDSLSERYVPGRAQLELVA